MAELTLKFSQGVAVLTLSRPERRNAITPEMAREIIDACDRIDSETEIGAAAIVGDGGFFCAGAHRETLAAASRDPLGDESYDEIETIYRSFKRVGELQVPCVAAVRGGAVGAGLNLALAADLRIVGQDATLISGFVQLGIHPGGGHFSLLARAGGREAAAAMALFGERITGRRACELGIAWEAVPDDGVDGRALELCDALAGDPVLARQTLRTMRGELGPPAVAWDVALEMERGVQLWSFDRKRRQQGSSG